MTASVSISPICAAVNTVAERVRMTNRSEIARRSGCDRTTVIRYLSGETQPSDTAIANLEVAFGVKPGTIYREAGRHAERRGPSTLAS